MELNVGNVVKLLKELLVVHINSVLYYHEVYPRYIFEKVKSFNQIAYVSRSEKLSNYINKFVDDFVALLINSNNINELMVILYKPNSNVASQDHMAHKYVIKFNEFVQLSTKIKDDFSAKIDLPNFSWPEVYKQFNSFLFQHLQYLKAVKEISGLEFKLVVNSDLNLNVSDNWVSNRQPLKSNFIHPLDEVSVGFINISSYVEADTTINSTRSI